MFGLFRRQTDENGEEIAETGPGAQLRHFFADLVYRLPYVPQLRIFAHDLQAVREWYPIVLPLLFFIAWRTYRRERRQLQAPPDA